MKKIRKTTTINGITLIALVITIVVLLILAGITISTLSGENGILNKATEAKIKTEDAQNEELLKISVLSSLKNNGKVDIEILKSEIDSIGGEIITNEVSDDKFPLTITKGNVTLMVYEDGNTNTISTSLSDVYVYLYNDGTLVFSNTTTEDYLKSYGNIKGQFYTSELDENGNLITNIPWENDKDSITKVEIESLINPLSTANWFAQCYNLTSIQGLDKLDTTYVTSMNRMFLNCNKLTTIDVSTWDTSNVTNMYAMFAASDNQDKMLLTQIKGIENWNVSNVEDMQYMFLNCSSLTSLDLSKWNTAKVTTMDSMFRNCTLLTQLDISNFNTSNVTSMIRMFAYCSSLTQLNLSSFNTINVTSMAQMFGYCSSLTSLNLSNFNTKNVTDLNQTFAYCSGLKELDLSNFDTTNVTIMNAMFWHCESLTQLNLNSFSTPEVKDMGTLFAHCVSLRTLDLSNFDTTNVFNKNYMFLNVPTDVEIKTNENTQNWIVQYFPTYNNFIN